MRHSISTRGLLLRSLAMAIAAASPLSAQVLTGAPRDSSTGAIIPAVVVSLLGARDSVLGQGVSDLRGYSIRLVEGTTRVQFRRIGYAPLTVPYSADLQGRLDVVLRRLPVYLRPVVTTAARDKQCEDGVDDGEALAVWAEVRASLLATHLGRQIPARVSLLQYQRPGDGPRIQSVMRIDNPGALRAFGAALPADTLARLGYVRQMSGGVVYLAPDELVLVDDSFLQTHCFTSVVRNNRDSTITVRFSPLRDRNIPDVAGDAVLRGYPLELLRVTFRYTGLPREALQARPSGALLFQDMPNGIPMMHRWDMRAVNAARLATSLRLPGADRSRETWIVNPWETGSLIERFEIAGFPPLEVTFADVAGRIQVGGRPAGAAGFRVTIENTPYRAVTDSLGEFRIASVFPGAYAIHVEDTVYAPFGVARSIRKRVEVTNRPTRVDDLKFLNLDDMVERACREDAPFNPEFPDVQGQGIVLARLDSGPFATGGVPFSATLHADPRVPVSVPKTVTGTTSKGGYLRLCNFPVRRRVTITVKLPDGREVSGSVLVDDAAPRLVTIRQQER